MRTRPVLTRRSKRTAWGCSIELPFVDESFVVWCPVEQPWETLRFLRRTLLLMCQTMVE